MKCPLGPKKRAKLSALTGREVWAAYVRGGWDHSVAQVWFVDDEKRYYWVNRRTGEVLETVA